MVLVPRELFRVVLGTTSVSAVRSGSAFLSSSAPEMAVTAPGTSWISSVRRRAVTITFSISRFALSVEVSVCAYAVVHDTAGIAKITATERRSTVFCLFDKRITVSFKLFCFFYAGVIRNATECARFAY